MQRHELVDWIRGRPGHDRGAPAATVLLFGAQGNDLEAYALDPPFVRQTVNHGHQPSPPETPDPNGLGHQRGDLLVPHA